MLAKLLQASLRRWRYEFQVSSLRIVRKFEHVSAIWLKGHLFRVLLLEQVLKSAKPEFHFALSSLEYSIPRNGNKCWKFVHLFPRIPFIPDTILVHGKAVYDRLSGIGSSTIGRDFSWKSFNEYWRKKITSIREIAKLDRNLSSGRVDRCGKYWE